ncbi:hypothetical protein FACS1894132_07280 [Clostridia bacterium]|nr:hypothetical protein FACS1894132_07280 [Clostridia bacterium]
MRVAVIGSRSIAKIDIERFLPEKISEIVSGGAIGIDSLAKEYAVNSGLKFTEFLPEYNKYGCNAPLKRNDSIVEYAEFLVILWDGQSRGTAYVIKKCEELNKTHKIYIVSNNQYTALEIPTEN